MSNVGCFQLFFFFYLFVLFFSPRDTPYLGKLNVLLKGNLNLFLFKMHKLLCRYTANIMWSNLKIEYLKKNLSGAVNLSSLATTGSWPTQLAVPKSVELFHLEYAQLHHTNLKILILRCTHTPLPIINMSKYLHPIRKINIKNQLQLYDLLNAYEGLHVRYLNNVIYRFFLFY